MHVWQTYVVVKRAVFDEVVDVAKELAAKLAIVVITALNEMLVKSFFLPKSLEWMLETKFYTYNSSGTAISYVPFCEPRKSSHGGCSHYVVCSTHFFLLPKRQ